MANLKDVVDYMIYRGNGDFSIKQINRFLYYSYAIYLAKYNDKYEEPVNRLFEAEFKAYPRGPIIEEAYDYMKENEEEYFWYDRYSKYKAGLLEDSKDKLNRQEKFVVNAVLKVYGKYSGNRLEAMVNDEAPYKDFYRKNRRVTIPEKVIFDDYTEKYKIPAEQPKELKKKK